MYKWTVSHAKDKNLVILYDCNTKTQVYDVLCTLWDVFDTHVTRHWICGNGLPDALWEIPVGKPQRDPSDGWLDNSIAMRVAHYNDRLLNWFDRRANPESQIIAKITIDDETLVKIWPEMKDIID